MTAQILFFPNRFNHGLPRARRTFERACAYYDWVIQRFDARSASSRIMFRHADRQREIARERYLGELRA